jgi:histidinol-phosphate aminotransferase
MSGLTIDIQQLVRPNILRMKAYSSARHDFKGEADIYLDANENPNDTGFNRYPDPLQWTLKHSIAELKQVPAEKIFLGNGSDEAIDLLIRIFCEPREDHIMVLPPTYGMYQVSAAISDIGVKEVTLTKDFQPDVERILAQSDANTKILFLCSPNNPTGNSMKPKIVRKLLEGFPGIVVVDEAYIDFSAQPSSSAWLYEFNNLVVLQTFSKAWGLAGIRLGMAFANEEIIQLFNKVKPPYNINQLTQDTAYMALENLEEKEAWVNEILSERKRLTQELIAIDCVKKVYPSDANFLLAEVKDAQSVYDFLVTDRIIVRNRSNVILCENCLRFTIGTPLENELLIEALLRYE